MININEVLPQKGIITSEIQSEVDGNHIKITARTLKRRNKKPIEQELYFTRNGLTALIANLQVAAFRLEEGEKHE
ncbi:hypothetical protein [Ligilactobacillus acidipiscis]|uniref:Uncharacterized protein n=1 Tax=Ligilactobacillus acidipiscis TaxID=89059 RepID=A0A0R2KFG7_9LACO|nr:hypothetical protein [Ligilactobacillus acidipiscis]KRN88176.1 hypothetical protein IV43_GL000026 [Ligilactobacillus acidipiscis]